MSIFGKIFDYERKNCLHSEVQLFDFSLSYLHSRIALVNPIRLHIFSGYATNGKDSITMDRHTGANRRLCTYPCPIFYPDWGITVWHGGMGIIMVACQKHCTLRNAYIATDGYPIQIVYSTPFPQPTVVTHLQIPG